MSKTLARILLSGVKAASAWQKPVRQAHTLLRLSSYLHRHDTIATAAGPISFVTTHPQALDYPTSLLTREKDTIAWLDRLTNDDVLWDIGANVGAYALYGARRGAQVWAFEPAPASFAALSENIRINRLDDRIVALPIAMGGTTGLGKLAMSSTNPGSVGHNLGGSGDSVIFNQSVMNYTADDFHRTYNAPRPTYIKLDVDGIEPDILEGARDILADPKLRSLLVEVDRKDSEIYRRVCKAAEDGGLKLTQHLIENAIFDRP
jgi:FkbM family methyltransferase